MIDTFLLRHILNLGKGAMKWLPITEMGLV